MVLLEPHRLRRLLETRSPEPAGRVRVGGHARPPPGCALNARTGGGSLPTFLGSRTGLARGRLGIRPPRLENPGSWLSLATIDGRPLPAQPAQRAAGGAVSPGVFSAAALPAGDQRRGPRRPIHPAWHRPPRRHATRRDSGGSGPRVRREPDILGISATFGQHDLMIRLLDAAYGLPRPPLVVVGGSLTARNEGLLLERYPRLLVARGGGEATMEGLLAHWHGDIDLDHVPGLGFNGAARGGGLALTRRRTARPLTRDATADIFPELDLLPATFEHHGVAQLETSRGCTNFCSFCPRGHKGMWSGAAPEQLPWMLAEMRRVFDRTRRSPARCTWWTRSSSAGHRRRRPGAGRGPCCA